MIGTLGTMSDRAGFWRSRRSGRNHTVSPAGEDEGHVEGSCDTKGSALI